MRTEMEQLDADDNAPQDALFEIQVDEEDGCVWICSPEGRDIWCQNLGPIDKVQQTWAEWLTSRNYGER